jgi:hypothetical protein
LEPGRIKLASGGSNTWLKENIGHCYLVEAILPSVPEDYINKLMMHQPVKNRSIIVE